LSRSEQKIKTNRFKSNVESNSVEPNVKTN